MTQPQSSARRDTWLRAVGYGLLAEIATIITIIVVVMLQKYVIARGLSDADYVAFGQRAGAVVGIFGGTLYTSLFARRLMPMISSRFVAHGIVVAVAATALSILGSVAGHKGVPTGYILASALKIVAGALAGFVYNRSLALNRTA